MIEETVILEAEQARLAAYPKPTHWDRASWVKGAMYALGWVIGMRAARPLRAPLDAAEAYVSPHDPSSCPACIALRRDDAEASAAAPEGAVTIRDIIRERHDFSQGTRVTNCALHMALPFASRPRDCMLCWTDVLNQLALTVRVNGFLNGLFDQLEAADALGAARSIVEYVSRGRGFVDVEPYPDAAARAVLGASSTPEGP